MKHQLSVLCPGIRPQNWVKLYNSIGESFSGRWEIVFISPYGLPPQLKEKQNVTHISDFGTPIRCQQRGLIESNGEWITWAADDGFYLNNALNIGFIKLAAENMNKKVLVMGKYIEGHDHNGVMKDNPYYVLSNHDASFSKYLPKNYLMLNVGIVSRETLLEVGGWDCQFEVCPMAYNDLAVRLQNHGVRFLIQDEIMFKCGHMPGHEGDHGPIHDAQVDHDQPLYQQIWTAGREVERRIFIDLDNWKNTPERWERRFGKI